ncbi:L-threonylcarbamoyladenylate synthase [Undibacterium flavidum]|uniref:L-threonylcarbamoyladenylate synthase n=1 Tax=Undibacterium flavidum TaxID=2762297 RepID=UPI0038B4B19F
MRLDSSEQILAAARALEHGALVGFPTETVYGLGADAENIDAVANIYKAKGRPSNHPVIVHVAPEADITYWVKEVPALAQTLIDAFWPGPLTLILKRAEQIPDAVSGGQDSIGIRCPSHPVAQALLRAFKDGKGGVAAPSANKFGHVSPTKAEHVLEEFPAEVANGMIAAVLDGGQSDVGIESTIVDMSRLATHGPVLLRPGHITAAQLEHVLGMSVNAPDQAAPRASGTLEAHYAPSTPVAMVAVDELETTILQLLSAGKRVAVMAYQPHTANAQLQGWRQLNPDPVSYAHDLYADLRELDHVGADIILVEALPTEREWQGVADRLRRAAFDSQGLLQTMLTA